MIFSHSRSENAGESYPRWDAERPRHGRCRASLVDVVWLDRFCEAFSHHDVVPIPYRCYLLVPSLWQSHS